MKKLFFLLLILVLLCCPALADEAQDITENCTIAVSDAEKKIDAMFDGDYKTYWTSTKRGYVTIDAPMDQPIYGLYVNWARYLVDWAVEAYDSEDGQWREVYVTEDEFYNQYIPLPEGYTSIRLRCKTTNDHTMEISELKVLGEGDVPSWVQQWKNFTGKADLVLMVADPGDEYMFFGGLIPKYVAEGKEVMLCVIINTFSGYKSQLLDGLWHCGMTNYPYIAYFKPNLAPSAKEQYAIWSEVQFVRHVTRIVRIYDPDVMVTHARSGEGADGAHKVCADAAVRAMKLAMDSKYDIGYGYKLYGNWQPKKLYLHITGDNQTVLDYDQPLDFFGGKTALQVAEEAYAMQDYLDWISPALKNEGVYDGSSYGLVFTTVGEDTGKGDLFENID